MRRRSFIVFSLGLSALLHLAVVSFCSLHIKAKGDPSLYGRFNIVSRKDLFPEKREVIFPEGINFSSHDMRKKYFSLSRLHFLKDDEEYSLGLLLPEFKGVPFLKGVRGGRNYFYLWKRGVIFPSREEENISYKAYISPHGKVLFLYPEKLPANSYGNLQLQEYLRNAAFFPGNRFFWTNLGGVVK